VTADANLGLAIHDRPLMLPSPSDFLAWGLAVTRPLGPRTELVAEAAGPSARGRRLGRDRRSRLEHQVRTVD
jgi:hypothetical protein